MAILNYLASIVPAIALYNVDEDRKRMVITVKTSRELTEEQKEECRELGFGMNVDFRVQG